MVLPGEIDVEVYIRELESTIGRQIAEIETLRNENESLKKRLLLYENPHTPPSRQMIRPKITNPPGKRGAPMGHKGATKVLGEPDEPEDDDSIKTALKQAYVEVEGETLKNLGDRDLLILAALVKNQDTNRAYSEVSASSHLLLRGVSKSTFFQSVNYLQNLGLITLIKKKIGRYYTMESQILLSDESIVYGELRKR